MKIATCVAACAAVLVSACASEPHPWKRPLSLDQASAMADTNVSLVENNDGVEATWFVADNSAAGAQYGLIGALVTATMDGMINAGPSDAAQKIADEIATVAAVDKINQSFSTQMKSAVAADTMKVRYANVVTTQKITTPATPDDTVEVNISYVLSEDASTMKVVAGAVYQRTDAKYVTPYTFKSPPKEETEGPLYRNSFTYESNRLALPTLTPALKAVWVEEINQRYIKQNGYVPSKKGDKGLAGYRDAVNEANNDTLTKAESSSVLAKAWLANDGALLFNEVQTAHAYIAKYLLADLNSSAVPSLTGQDEIVEQLADGRVVRLLGAGEGAGSYVSSPGSLTTFTTYGNAVQVAKVHRDRAESIKASMKKSK